MNPSLRLIMLGTGDFALPTFEHLIETGHQLVALVTQPDRPQGRKQEIIPSLIKQKAQSHGIPVFQPEDVNAPASLDRFAVCSADLLITAAYGQILSADLLSIPTLGGINLHGSILPAYRGAAPVARAIQNGETETGVTVIRMSPRIDAGGIDCHGRHRDRARRDGRRARGSAREAGGAAGRRASSTHWLLARSRSWHRIGARSPRRQSLRKEDGVIDWSLPAQAIHNLVRAMQPWPAASTSWQPRTGESRPPLRLIVHRTEIAHGPGRSRRGARSHGKPPGRRRRNGAVAARGQSSFPARRPARPATSCGPPHRARRPDGMIG